MYPLPTTTHNEHGRLRRQNDSKGGQIPFANYDVPIDSSLGIASETSIETRTKVIASKSSQSTANSEIQSNNTNNNNHNSLNNRIDIQLEQIFTNTSIVPLDKTLSPPELSAVQTYR